MLRLCLALSLASTAVHAQAPPRPNFVVFLSDDMGWEQVGFNGGKEVPTPNIDRIADEGVKLTQLYVQPVCSPTRACLLTGRYAWKNGMEVRPTAESRHGMLLDERTIAEALREVGYDTWMVGKWHLGEWQRPHLPLQRGFDHHYGHYSALIDSFTHMRGPVLDWHRNGRPVVEEGYSTFLLADEAERLIERHDGRSPFFLYLPFNAVHGPHQAPEEYLARYAQLGRGGPQRAQLECMDRAVGSVIRALEREGVLDSTLVMFTNDNGGTRITSNGPYRGFKSHYHEGGVRVPAAMRWPDQIPAGSASDEMLHIVDLFPTFARLAGAKIDSGLPLDGRDAWDAIANAGPSPRQEVVHSLEVIRVGDWKLIEEGASYYGWRNQPLQLFDIRQDPYEETNLAESHPEKVAELRARLAFHRKSAREPEELEQIPGYPPVVYGEVENEVFGEQVEEKLAARQ
ncbi:MAG: arylsulfatase [Bryobacterales bacterium]|nr:arylsulfatase [Bryobacterales bacterium]MDE0621475.1 arylsulfatase [Bryobacterales bacterium]